MKFEFSYQKKHCFRMAGLLKSQVLNLLIGQLCPIMGTVKVILYDQRGMGLMAAVIRELQKIELDTLGKLHIFNDE